MAELLITSSLDPIEEGQVFIRALPRHVTIWQYFTLADTNVDAFTHDAGEAVAGFLPIQVRGIESLNGDTGPDLFGPNNDVAVRRIEKVGRGATVTALHTVLGGIIDRYDGEVRNPEWAYEGYNPHVTYVGNRALEVGEQSVLRTVELIRRSAGPPYKIVEKVWNLEEPHETTS